MASRIEPFCYRLPRPAVEVYPGAHPGQMVGNGQLFKRHEALLARPDPRRLDLRASLLDPFGQYRVKAYQEHDRVEVMVLADLSASLAYSGVFDKRQVMLDLIRAIAESALACGDRIGFAGFGAGEKPLLYAPPGGDLSWLSSLNGVLEQLPQQRGCHGLWQADAYLPRRRALLFLLGDGHWPTAQLPALLASVGRHELVPLLIWDAAEYRALPDWGLLALQDPESGRRRRLWLRPSLKRRIELAYSRRRCLLQRLFRAAGSEPLFIEQGYRVEQFNRYFLERAA
ncbi:MxaS protein [Methylomonas sp. SURF-1]|uniref:MxaS protein n=1 Tax=Methylomonas aurea TaxID=2952224 RepID=A0ABT1UD71_9GAMM|nr:MxaS protein [Methylomonas sp. SURF-1]MCQ8180166.1 MxaS protein [Methylomonas sp. SURF-1]